MCIRYSHRERQHPLWLLAHASVLCSALHEGFVLLFGVMKGKRMGFGDRSGSDRAVLQGAPRPRLRLCLDRHPLSSRTVLTHFSSGVLCPIELYFPLVFGRKNRMSVCWVKLAAQSAFSLSQMCARSLRYSGDSRIHVSRDSRFSGHTTVTQRCCGKSQRLREKLRG